jgi:hypothetical protein
VSSFLGRRALGRVAVIAPALALAVALSLTGCSRLGALGDHSGAGAAPTTVGGAASTPPSSPTSPAPSDAADPSSLDSIAQDLGSADAANQQADTDTTAGDQAAATNDDQ